MRPEASKKMAKVTPKKGPNPVIIGAVVAAVVIVGVVVAIVIGTRSQSGGGSSTASAAPVGVVGGTGGGILVNPAAAKSNVPTLDVYADFQCPNCARFEEQFGPAITAMAKAGEVKYVVHMMSFLDTNLGNDSSKRATNAAACGADAGKFPEYHSAVFAAQPAKEGDGYTDAQLTEFATAVGITGPALTTWQQCTSSGHHDRYVADVATTSGKAGVTGTPTVRLNGKDMNKTLTTPEALVAAVKAAAS